MDTDIFHIICDIVHQDPPPLRDTRPDKNAGKPKTFLRHAPFKGTTSLDPLGTRNGCSKPHGDARTLESARTARSRTEPQGRSKWQLKPRRQAGRQRAETTKDIYTYKDDKLGRAKIKMKIVAPSSYRQITVPGGHGVWEKLIDKNAGKRRTF